MPTVAELMPSRRRLQPVIAWALAVLVLVGVVGVIWATGGFDRGATPYRGPEVQPGDVIETRFWDVTVHEGAVYPAEGELRLKVTVTNKQDLATPVLTATMLIVRRAGIGPMVRSTCLADRGDFQPSLPTEAVCTFSFELNEVPAPPAGPMQIEVVVLDQMLSDGLDSAPHPKAVGPAGWLQLTAPEVTEEEA